MSDYNKRIVICDDEIHILRAVEFKLKRAGYEVECAHDGEQAWEAIHRERPALLITDCQMPRLDGFGLIRRAREDENLKDLPVLMLTGKGLELPREEILGDLEVNALIGKPFSPKELLKHVEKIVPLPRVTEQEPATAEKSD